MIKKNRCRKTTPFPQPIFTKNNRSWELYNLLLYAKNRLILFEFAAVIVCHIKYAWQKHVAGKLPLPLNWSSLKSTGFESSATRAHVQNIIWLCLNLRSVSYTHLDVYKRQVYVSDHSTVVKAEAVSRKKYFFVKIPSLAVWLKMILNINFRTWKSCMVLHTDILLLY